MNSNCRIDVDEFLKAVDENIQRRGEWGSKTKKTREESGVSRPELAETLGIQEADVASFEEGKPVSKDAFGKLVLWTEEQKPGEIY